MLLALPLRVKDHLTQTSIPDMKSLFWVISWSYLGYSSCHWLTQAVEGKSLFLKTLCTLKTGSRGPWARADLNVSSMKSSFYGNRKYHVSFQIREVIKSPVHMWYLWITSMIGVAWHPYKCSSAMHTLAVTNGSVIGLNIYSTKGIPCLVL